MITSHSNSPNSSFSFNPYQPLHETGRITCLYIYLDHILFDLQKACPYRTYAKIEIQALRWLIRESGIETGTFRPQYQYNIVNRIRDFKQEYSITKDFGIGVSNYLQYFMSVFQTFHKKDNLKDIGDCLRNKIVKFFGTQFDQHIHFYQSALSLVVQNGPDRNRYACYSRPPSNVDAQSRKTMFIATIIFGIIIGVLSMAILVRINRAISKFFIKI